MVAPADEDIPLRAGADKSLAGKIAYATKPLLYGLKHRHRFDVLHLYFGESLFSFSRRFSAFEMWDLPLWKALGKRVFMTFQGCDVRQKGASAREPVTACKAGYCDYALCDSRMDAKRTVMVRRVLRFVDKVFCLNPDHLQWVSGEFLPYANIDPASISPSREPAAVPLLVHAPSNRSIKGTVFIENASARLGTRVPHRLQLIENLPRRETLSLLGSATLAIDQVLLGWYGGFAVEAMAFGLPVIAYINDRFFPAVPEPMRAELPVVSATPETLAERIEELLASPGRCRELGERGRRYVQRWHDPKKIAGRMLELYVDPAQGFWDGYRPERGSSGP
jgi:hypothetical protein